MASSPSLRLTRPGLPAAAVPGTSPLNRTRPLGAAKGGGIWLHVDHGGPTHGCVSLAKEHMKALLRTLDPDRHPVIVMGDTASLGR